MAQRRGADTGATAGRPSSAEAHICSCAARKVDLAGVAPKPWELLAARYPDVKVYLRSDTDPLRPDASLGSQRWGHTIWRAGLPEIYLAVDLGKIQRRCTLAHEVVHVMRGAPCRPLCPVDEQYTGETTARWLLPDLCEVADTLARHDVLSAAERLQVTRTVLTQRLDGLECDEVVELTGHMRKVT